MNTNLNEEIKININDLLCYLHDSSKGYRECAEEINNLKLKALFERLSEKRKGMIDEIKHHFPALIHKNNNGTFTGVLHRVFLNLKNLLSNGDEEAIINEIKRGENTLIDAYKKLINDSLPDFQKNILFLQLDQVVNDVASIDLESIKE
jgi:uncharacterized protein (TIGR02284 family)